MSKVIDKELSADMDVRLAERLLKRGHVTRKDLDKVLKQLPDVKAKAAPLESSEE